MIPLTFNTSSDNDQIVLQTFSDDISWGIKESFSKSWERIFIHNKQFRDYWRYRHLNYVR